MSLSRDQRWLLEAITGPAAPGDLARIAGSGRVPAAIGLGIYRHAYRARLRECLADDFPALRALLGGDAFDGLAGAVIDRDPPREATLNRYGARLVAFLRRQPQATAHGPLARDLARLEWALVEAIHAPSARPADPAALASLPAARWAGARLVAAPSLRLVASSFPINGCYRQHLRDEAVSAPVRDPEVVAVVRRIDGLERHAFIPRVGRLIGRLAKGMPLGRALEASGLAPDAIRTALATAWNLGCFTTIIPGRP